MSFLSQLDERVMRALCTIHEEHQAIAAMLQALSALVHGIREYRMQPNFDLMRAMLYYARTFPERSHHPKEEHWVFRLLAGRHPPARPLLARLCDEHRIGSEMLQDAGEALRRYERKGAPEFAAFCAAIDAFVAFERHHMAVEERDAFPLAERHLTADDWEAIDEAFAADADPLPDVATHDGFEPLRRPLTGQGPGRDAGPAGKT